MEKGIKNEVIPERIIYILLVFVIFVSILGTLLVLNTVDKVIEENKINAAVTEVPDMITSSKLSVEILPNPNNGDVNE